MRPEQCAISSLDGIRCKNIGVQQGGVAGAFYYWVCSLHTPKPLEVAIMDITTAGQGSAVIDTPTFKEELEETLESAAEQKIRKDIQKKAKDILGGKE